MNIRNTRIIIYALFSVLFIGCSSANGKHPQTSISGIYPTLASYNDEGECGTGAVVPWAGKLWVITYGPHMVVGSTDKLYEISPDYQMIVRDESTGGTAANRMIHKESNQLFIGPYAIDSKGNVRSISYEKAPGRYTGTARHLTNPEEKVYIGTMEEGFYEIDVNTLEPKVLYTDANYPRPTDLLYGTHGKGLYSGQGVLVYSNNGEYGEEALRKFNIESGSLSEWDGKDWKLVRRNQFVEVTGPDGIYGSSNPATDPIWATGWDYKSVLLAVREPEKGWTFYRLPKASHSYDGAHGWNTEWPRIRNVGTDEKPDYLMTMHGLFWNFPKSFSTANSAGIRPRSAYLKVIGDFARWNDQIVFGCDDAAQNEFLNYERKVKGGIGGAGQSNSNLWFTSFDTPDKLGPATAEGAIWSREHVKAETYSDPFMFCGWNHKSAWIDNAGKQAVTYTFEVDEKGNNTWKVLKAVEVGAGQSVNVMFADNEQGEWVRVKTNVPTTTTLSFAYRSDDSRLNKSDDMFAGLTTVKQKKSVGGILYALGDNRRALAVVANANNNGAITETAYYEMGDKFELIRKDDEQAAAFVREKFAIHKKAVDIDESSVIIVDGKERRWRLPLGNPAYNTMIENGILRLCREVATERDLFNCHGTFYELPAENADGFAKMRPIASHDFAINDYASYRGMLVMTGISPKQGKNNPHIVVSDDQKAAVWVGAIDDLWKMGKPIGQGGPWKNTAVKAGVPSDAYLFAFYDKRTMTLSHETAKDIKVRVEMDPTGNGDWMEYNTFDVKKGQNLTHEFPAIEARWIRFVSLDDATVTAWLEYK